MDEFLRRMGEMFECVLFTASLSKVTLLILSPSGQHNYFAFYSLLPVTAVSAAGCRRVTGSAPLLPVTTVSAAGCRRVTGSASCL